MIQETFPMIVGEEEVLNERELLVRVESGLMMDSTDSVRYIILHCSATRCNSDYTVEQLLRDHRARGFRTIGYHFYIRRDGTVSQHRRLLEVGAHCRPFSHYVTGRRRPSKSTVEKIEQSLHDFANEIGQVKFA